MAGAALVGCGVQERPATVETTQVPPSNTRDKPATNQNEGLGQNTEIARDQLNMMEQSVSLEEMEAMSVEDFARVAVADRSQHGYALARRTVPESEQTYNVAPLTKTKRHFTMTKALRCVVAT